MAPVLKFLRFSSGTNAEKDFEILDKAAAAAKQNEINVEIIRETSEIRKLLSGKGLADQSIHVCFPFEGHLFQKFRQNGFRIIGPQCVISCLLLQIPVPKKTYPVCNVSMLGVTACCSSMKKDERNTLHDLIQKMGGEVTGDFTSIVTHLIANEVGSKKYQVAANNKLPIVSPRWVHSCWESSKYDHVIASSETFIKDHILPIFKGCTICVTGLDIAQRENIKSIVHDNGGVYSGELNMKTCTHLLVQYPQGAKYKYARQWKLHCVTPSWLHDCVKQGHWLVEEPYKVEPEPDSTISKSGNTTTRHEIQETLNNNTTVDVAGSFQSKAAENAAKSLRNSKQHKQVHVENCENQYRKLVFREIQLEQIDVHNFTFQDCENYYLDGCEIYLQNNPGAILDCCRKIINNGGGMRLSVLEDSITHVVLWENPSSEVKNFLLECHGVLPHVVSPLWLIDSFKNGEVMDVKDYSVVDVIDKDIEEESEVFTKPALPAFATSVSSRFEEGPGDDTTLMNQYLSTNHESTRLSQAQYVGTDHKEDANNFTKPVETLADDETVSIGEEPSPFLQGWTFSIQRFSNENKANIESLIKEFSGSVTSSHSECDHTIVPLIYTNKEISMSPKELTICWLEQSIENEVVVDQKSSFLFHPILIPEDVKPLKGCVVTISQYSGMERQHLLHLAEVLGAVAQEFFVRKDSNKAGVSLKANTHLILHAPEGSKYDASLKWGVPCVGKRWLYKCATSRKRIQESLFSLDNCNGDNNDGGTCDGDDENDEIQMCHNKLKDNELVSFDLSNRGASIMDRSAVRRQSEITMSKREVDLSIEETNDVEVTGITITNSNSKTKASNLNDICSGEVKENDFASFNNIISNERNNSITEDVMVENNVSNTSPTVESPRFALNKSRFLFDFTNALDGIQSPAVGTSSQDVRRKSNRKSRGSLPFDVQFSEALQRAVDKHVPEEERAPLEESFNNRKKEVLGTILQGCICVVSKKLLCDQQQVALHKMVVELGGETKSLYDAKCTHFIHQGRVNDMSKDYVTVKKENRCYIVSPYWLEACVENNKRVNERDYPLTYNPKMLLDVVMNRSNIDKEQLSAREIVKDNTILTDNASNLNRSSVVTSVDDINKEQPGIVKNNRDEVNRSGQQLDVQKKMEELMEATKPLPRNRRQPRRPTGSSTTKTETSAVGQTFNRRLRSRTSSQSKNSESPHSSTTIPDPTNEQSQAHVISYDVDATEREARERVLAQLKQASPSQDIESLDYPINKLKLPSATRGGNEVVIIEEDDQDEQVKENTTRADTTLTTTTNKSNVINLLYDEEGEKQKAKQETAEKYKFLFSGMTVADKIHYGAIIEQLGGTMLDMQYFNTQCTHVIVHSPTRSEKYLAAVASGKWILHKSYLEASREEAKFVDEVVHEWGSRPGASDFNASGKRWRVELENERTHDAKAGAFKGWVVLLCIETSKQPGFKRILEAGGGRVQAVRPPFDCIEDTTHAFIGDKRQAAKHGINYQQLQDAGIWILKPEFISDFLTVHPKPSALNYVLEEVQPTDDIDDNGAPSTPGKRKASHPLTKKEKRHRRDKS